MRRAVSLFITALAVYLLAGIPPIVHALDYSYARIVRLSLVEGSVTVARPGETGQQKAVVNLPLERGYEVESSADGRAEVEFESREVADLAGNSNLTLSELALENGGRITRLAVGRGTASFSAHPARDDSFTVQALDLTLFPVKKSSFRVDVEGGRADVRVFDGAVEVQSPAGARRVKKGHALFEESGSIQISANPPADAWDRWVASRNQIETAQLASTQRYAQAPFTYGLADMAAFGDWYSMPGYGYVWQPWGVPAGWAPFYNGYWGFFPGFGWTWVSYEPWGWVPYHFGRWAFVPGFGWAWVPGYYNYWCPAPVYWYQTANWIGWAPLPPRTPVGRLPVQPPRTPIVTNSAAGLLKHAPNRILEPPAGTAAMLSAFAPLPATGLGPMTAGSLPRVIAPLVLKPPRALPAPVTEPPRRVVITPAPPTIPSGSKTVVQPQPVPRAPRPVTPRIPSTAPPPNRPPIPSPRPMPRAPQPMPSAPPRGAAPPHHFAMQGAPQLRMETPAMRAPRMNEAPPRMMAEPRVFAAPPRPAPTPPHR
jgi:Family of unknown function (DUF6600)/FecR protein